MSTSKVYKARKAISIFEHGFAPEDIIPLDVLQRMPGGYRKLINGGFVVEVDEDEG